MVSSISLPTLSLECPQLVASLPDHPSSLSDAGKFALALTTYTVAVAVLGSVAYGAVRVYRSYSPDRRERVGAQVHFGKALLFATRSLGVQASALQKRAERVASDLFALSLPFPMAIFDAFSEVVLDQIPYSMGRSFYIYNYMEYRKCVRTLARRAQDPSTSPAEKQQIEAIISSLQKTSRFELKFTAIDLTESPYVLLRLKGYKNPALVKLFSLRSEAMQKASPDELNCYKARLIDPLSPLQKANSLELSLTPETTLTSVENKVYFFIKRIRLDKEGAALDRAELWKRDALEQEVKENAQSLGIDCKVESCVTDYFRPQEFIVDFNMRISDSHLDSKYYHYFEDLAVEREKARQTLGAKIAKAPRAMLPTIDIEAIFTPTRRSFCGPHVTPYCPTLLDVLSQGYNGFTAQKIAGSFLRSYAAIYCDDSSSRGPSPCEHQAVLVHGTLSPLSVLVAQNDAGLDVTIPLPNGLHSIDRVKKKLKEVLLLDPVIARSHLFDPCLEGSMPGFVSVHGLSLLEDYLTRARALFVGFEFKEYKELEEQTTRALFELKRKQDLRNLGRLLVLMAHPEKFLSETEIDSYCSRKKIGRFREILKRFYTPAQVDRLLPLLQIDEKTPSWGAKELSEIAELFDPSPLSSSPPRSSSSIETSLVPLRGKT